MQSVNYTYVGPSLYPLLVIIKITPHWPLLPPLTMRFLFVSTHTTQRWSPHQKYFPPPPPISHALAPHSFLRLFITHQKKTNNITTNNPHPPHTPTNIYISLCSTHHHLPLHLTLFLHHSPIYSHLLPQPLHHVVLMVTLLLVPFFWNFKAPPIFFHHPHHRTSALHFAPFSLPTPPFFFCDYFSFFSPSSSPPPPPPPPPISTHAY